MGTTQRFILSGQPTNINITRNNGDPIPSNTNRRRLAKMERCPYKPFPFPIGTQIGELTIIDWQPHNRTTGRSSGWQPIVRCSCGWEGTVYRENLKHGRTTRCNNCAKITASTKRWWCYKTAMDNDEHRTRLLNRLSSCIGRCHTETNKQYPSYGGRGIYVHPEWRKDRSKFLLYIQTLEGWDNPNLELDRINVNGHYEPNNIRFVTRKQNIANRRSVDEQSQHIIKLEQECARLRSALSRAEQQIYNLEQQRPNYSP